MTDFYDTLNPGWFLQWGADIHARQHPSLNVVVVDESGRAICGIFRDKASITHTLVANDSKIYANPEYEKVLFS